MSNNIIREIEGQIKRKHDEIMKIQKVMDRLHPLKEDLHALERTLAIMRGNNTRDPRTPERAFFPMHSTSTISLPQLAVGVLKEQGKPLKGEHIIQLIENKGRRVRKLSLLGALYRDVKFGKTFTLVEPGVFGLKLWNVKK